MSGRTALPASFISPNRSILRHLSLLSSDQLLRGFRGQSFWAVTPSAIFFVVLSIQPKHSASSTASMYQNVSSSTGLPRFTTTQHSVSFLWFCMSHSRNSALDFASSKLCISISCCFNLHLTNSLSFKINYYFQNSKITIKNEILPHLSVAKRGFQSKSSLIEVINAILYKLKTGCQWEYLPVKELFSGKVLKYGAVFHHYNKWSKKGEWKSLWLQLLDKHRSELDMSSVDLDGSHTPAIRGGEEVGYQGRKKRKTTNALYLTDRKGLPLAMSVPKSGEHHDTHNIVAVMQNMMEDMAKANIRTDGLFLNADAGFDCAALRSVLKSYGIVSNICINKRNGTTNDSIVLDELLYRERYSIERTNAWMDSFRTILNRFDTTLRNWESWNYIAFSVMLLRKCARKRKV